MLESVMFLYSYGYYGGQIGNMLARWEQAGVFSYVLPFLLIFALVFGILVKTNLFKDKPINAVIAIAVGLMSLQFDFVPRFFAEIFPRVGVGLAIILAAIIFMGIFAPKQSWMTFTFFGIGAIILVVVLINTAGNIGWYQGYWWSEHWFDVTMAVFFLVIIAVIVGASTPPKERKFVDSPIMKSLFGEKTD